MPKEIFPVIPLDRIHITTIYQDVASEEIEKTVTIPIENVIQGIDGIKEIRSQSMEGRSFIELDIELGRDLKKIAQDVENEINRMEDFPEDAEDPIVTDIESEFPVIFLSVSGDKDELILREIADELEDRILDLPGVSKVIKQGYRDREIWIEIDPDRLYAYGLSIDKVVNVLRGRNFNLPGGTIKGEKEEIILRTVGEYDNLREIEDTVLLRRKDGKHVYIRDVGTVRETFEEETFYGRMNGSRSINLIVLKRRTGDTIKIANGVKKIKEEILSELPPSVSITISQDSSRWIKNRLKTMYNNGAIGLILVCLLLFLFLNGQMAFWTAVGIPASFLGAVIVMELNGMTINMLTLFSFILALGLVVDDSIVVTENVYRHLLRGTSQVEATVIGTQEVFAPVVSATLTTIAAFVPMLLMSGMMGKFMAVIPIVVTFSLISSLIECLLVLPSHLADFVRLPKNRSHKKIEGRFITFLRKKYITLLSYCLRNRYKFIGLVLLVALGVGYYAKNYMDFILFRAKDIPGFFIELETPEGTKLKETGRVLKEVEKEVAKLSPADLDSFSTLVGAQFDYHRGIMNPGTNLGQIYVELKDFDAPGRRNGFLVLKELRDKLQFIPGAQSLTVKEVNWGPPVGAPIEIKIRGKDYEILNRITQEVKQYLSTIEGIKDIKDDYKPGKWEMRIKVKEDKAAIYDLDVATIALAVKTSIGGTKANEIREGKDEIDLIVKLQENFRNNIEYIKNLKIENQFGELIPLNNVAEIDWEMGLTAINRKDQRRTITVSAEVDTDIITSNEANRLIAEHFADLSLRYPGYSLSFGGEHEEQQESIRSLIRAFIVAILLIYLILGNLFKSFFQPFMVMFAIPLGFIGVVVGHLVMGEVFGILSLIGSVALAGIVVNDSLILVDFINKSRRQGWSRWRSILWSGKVRLRPILLTSITTMAAISTLAFKRTGQDAFLAPMVISIVWGLLFSTILILLIIPCLYAISDDLMEVIFNSTKRVSWLRKKDNIELAEDKQIVIKG